MLRMKNNIGYISRHRKAFIVKMLVYLSSVLMISIIAYLLGYIFVKGLPHLNANLFQWENTTKNNSMLPAIINTFIMMGFTLIMAVPIGVLSAVYLVEYAKRGSRLVTVIRVTTETLSGIPSIVFGLFGYLAFVIALGWQNSLMAGAVTMAIMVLPLIMRTTEVALMSVPDSYREGSYGLGAGKLRTVFRIILPFATPGIMSGIILAAGRIVGETAALIFTAGTIAKVPNDVFDSTATLSVHMYSLLNEGLHMDEAYATAVVLILFVLVMNWFSKMLGAKISGGKLNS